MKKSKFSAMLMAALIVLSGCGMNNTTKGGLIGGGAGAGIGAMVGNLIGRNAGGTLAGAAIGGAVGTAAGVLIGKKMDKMKAAAEQVQNAQVEGVKDSNGETKTKTLPFTVTKPTIDYDGLIYFVKSPLFLLAIFALSFRAVFNMIL